MLKAHGGAMRAIRGTDTVTNLSGINLDNRRLPEGWGTGMFPIKSDPIDARFGDECGEAGHEVQGFEEHVGGGVARRGFEFVPDEALCS